MINETLNESSRLKLSRYLVVLDTSVGKTTRKRQILVFSTRSGRLLSIPLAMWRRLSRDADFKISSAAKRQLVSAEILVPSAEDEFDFLNKRSQSGTQNSRTLYRVVLATKKCNLSCSYCGQEHLKGDMPLDVQEALAADISTELESGRFDSLFLTWFGGEPTVAPGVIDALSKKLMKVCKSRKTQYRARMITNGTGLSRRNLESFVLNCGIQAFEVSLDGPGWVHDQRRPLKSGQGSYTKVVKNLTRFVREKWTERCSLTLRVNVDENNVTSIPGLLEDLASRGISSGVTIYFANVIQWREQDEENLITREDFAKAEVSWLRKAIHLGFSTKLLPVTQDSACLASQPSSNVVSTNGTVHNCTMTPMAPQAITSSIEPLGELGSDFGPVSDARSRSIFKGVREVEECRQCEFLFQCQGGCSKERESGRLPCPSFKFNIGSRMLLHYALSLDS